MSPVALVLEAAKRFSAHAAARDWLEQRAQQHMSRSPELERELFAVKTSWPGEGVTPLATSQRSIGEALSRAEAMWVLARVRKSSAMRANSVRSRRRRLRRTLTSRSSSRRSVDRSRSFS